MYQVSESEHNRYAKCIEVSKRIRWDIEQDVIRGRKFQTQKKFLPDSLSLVREMTLLSDEEKRFMSQIQGRTYANIFGLVERFICAKVMEVSQEHALGDQLALEALVRFSEEELKHQELFRTLDRMADTVMPDGYEFVPQPNEVAKAVLGKSTWAVLGLTLHIELFTQVHYKQSIEVDDNLSELWRDVFLFHWREESQHAIMDELEWKRIDKQLDDAQRDEAVGDLIDLVVAVDGILQAQSEADVKYFVANCERVFSEEQAREIQNQVLKAYRWQYILSGVQVPHFESVLQGLINQQQAERIGAAIKTLM